MSTVATAVRAMLECALWSSTGPDGEPLGASHDVSDIAPAAVLSLSSDLAGFIAANAADLWGMGPARIGHDFWLTRNRHGAGFWDRGLGAGGDRLTAAAHVYGEVDLCIGDDGMIHA